MLSYRYPPGYFVQLFTFDFFNYAGIHRPVRLYTTPTVYLSDITITTNFSSDVAHVHFMAVVSSLGSAVWRPDNNVTMNYQLSSKEGVVVASQQGVNLFEGTLVVKNPILWWPVGMNDQTAYLYTLKVSWCMWNIPGNFLRI